jgi:diguanylate cyclase (GGDEF)-like protein
VTSDPRLSLLALVLQAIGLVPLALLSFLLSRSIQRGYLDYWWRAWTSLVLALLALAVALWKPLTAPLLEPLYYFGEYLFGGLLIAGCRNFASGRRLDPRHALLLLPLAVLAVALPHLHPAFSVRFVPQAAVMSLLFGVAFLELRRAPAASDGRIGQGLLKLSLLALSLSFLHYVPVLTWLSWTGRTLPLAYASYTSLFDLLLETLLGFGTLIVVMEREHRELEVVNDALRATRAELEGLARIDPLTSSLNRHAFYSMVEGGRAAGPVTGCVAVADIDALKPINDTFGHVAGDIAIRAVARAVRQLVRADDLVFRWGGDEFLVVLLGVSEEEVRRRLSSLDQALAAVAVPSSPEPLSVTVSTGVAAFDSLTTLDRAIELADDRMYRQKEARRGNRSAAGAS